MLPERCATCPRKCRQLLDHLQAAASDAVRRAALPPADSRTEEATPSADWQPLCEPRLEAALLALSAACFSPGPPSG